MKIRKITPNNREFPEILKVISSVPKQLYYLGTAPAELLKRPAVAVVGSRKVSNYGQRVTEEFAGGLANHGVVVVSGLAIGVDTIAHQAVLDNGGKTIAVVPSGLDQIYPTSNQHIAKQIVESGGCILSEYPVQTEPYQSNFVARNRIVSGLANALVITEAAEKSGSLHTAKFALEQGREVCVVPGSIYNLNSVGANNLIKSGATPVTSVKDVLQAIGLAGKPAIKHEIVADSQEEYILMTLINDGVCDGEELLKTSNLEVSIFNQTLTMLEITGKIKSAGSDEWYLT